VFNSVSAPSYQKLFADIRREMQRGIERVDEFLEELLRTS